MPFFFFTSFCHVFVSCFRHSLTIVYGTSKPRGVIVSPPLPRTYPRHCTVSRRLFPSLHVHCTTSRTINPQSTEEPPRRRRISRESSGRCLAARRRLDASRFRERASTWRWERVEAGEAAGEAAAEEAEVREDQGLVCLCLIISNPRRGPACPRAKENYSSTNNSNCNNSSNRRSSSSTTDSRLRLTACLRTSPRRPGPGPAVNSAGQVPRRAEIPR